MPAQAFISITTTFEFRTTSFLNYNAIYLDIILIQPFLTQFHFDLNMKLNT